MCQSLRGGIIHYLSITASTDFIFLLLLYFWRCFSNRNKVLTFDFKFPAERLTNGRVRKEKMSIEIRLPEEKKLEKPVLTTLFVV